MTRRSQSDPCVEEVMRKRPASLIGGVLLCVPLVLVLLFTGCKKGENPPAQTAAHPEAARPAPSVPQLPPTPPTTPLGELVGVERSGKTTIEVMCPGGKEGLLEAKKGTEVFTIPSMSTLCGVQEKAGAGKTFVVLKFGAKAKRNFNDEVFRFASVTDGKYLARIDEKSWLSDGTGKKFKDGLLKALKGDRLLSFEIPSDATGLVWHYGKKQYQLEPHPAEIAEAALPVNTAPGK
jgi:hypothetical protein